MTKDDGRWLVWLIILAIFVGIEAWRWMKRAARRENREWELDHQRNHRRWKNYHE